MTGQVVDQVTADEARDAERFACAVLTTCQPPSSWCRDPWPATILNISTGGLRLRLGRRFEPGTGLAIELPSEDGSTSTVLARISRVEADGDGWVLGCSFISELSDDEVRTVLNLDPLRQASLADPDRGSAQGVAPSVNGVLFQTRYNNEVLRWYVKRLDLSANWPLPAGKVVAFRVGGGDAIEMTVKKCRRIGSYWMLECKFSHPLPDAVYRSLAAPAAQDG